MSIKTIVLTSNISIWSDLSMSATVISAIRVRTINEEARSLQFRCRCRGGGIVAPCHAKRIGRALLDKCPRKKRWCTRDRETDKTMGCLEIPILRAHDKRRSFGDGQPRGGTRTLYPFSCIQRFPGAIVGIQFACRGDRQGSLVRESAATRARNLNESQSLFRSLTFDFWI